MKHFSKLAALALACSLWSCSSDEPNGGVDSNKPAVDGDVFATITLQLPSSRSITNTPTDPKPDDYPASSNNGNEVGKDYENNVDAIYVVLATKNEKTSKYSFVASSYSSSILNQAASKATFTIQFDSEDLKDFVGEITDDSKKTAYVFTYCNPTPELKTYLDGLTTSSTEDFVDKICTLADGNNLPFAVKKNFMMTNALLETTQIPSLDFLIKNHNSVAKAFPLGTVKVERVVSRFDFQESDAPKDIQEKNSFVIKDNITGLTAAYVHFSGMSLFNEAKDFYYLPRMAAVDQDWTTTTDLCGYELVNNYVVSPNYTAKNTFNGTDYTIGNNYFFNLSTLPKDFNYTWVTETPDNDDWTGADGTNYKIWRYATENTMPVGSQKHGITTGVVFRAEIKALPESLYEQSNGANPAKTLANALKAENKAPIYAYTQSEKGKEPQINTMLGSAKDVWAYSYTHINSDIRSKFVAAVAAGRFTVTINGTQATTEETIFPEVKLGENETYKTWEEFLATVTVTGPAGNITTAPGKKYDVESNFNFVTFAPNEEGKYYTYYYYYNRHNDNGNSQDMGIMEFATVRNNIYKLKLNTVAGFGFPGDVTPDPGTNDENPEVYFQVSALVLDWVVRVNDIDF